MAKRNERIDPDDGRISPRKRALERSRIEVKQERGPSLVEQAHLLLGLSSFAAGLYVLWRVIDGVVLAPSSGTVQQVAPWDVWVKFGVAAIVAASLFWVALLLLGRSSRLAAERALIAAIEELDTSPGAQVEVLAGIAAG